MVLVSKADHCLSKLLALQAKDAFRGDIVAAAGNHTDLQCHAERAGVPFTHIPWPEPAADSTEHEAAHAQLLQANNVDLLVLARFTQIVRAAVCEFVPTVNLHRIRSALPSCRALRLLVIAMLVLGRHDSRGEVNR